MAFILPQLPYTEDELSPYISAETVGLHYSKHHKGYVDKLNIIVDNTEFHECSNDDLIEIIKKTHMREDALSTKIFNNSGQIWNHTFYWNSMKKGGGGHPLADSLISNKIDSDFGNIDTFCKLFSEAGENQFGSGWVWLVYDNGTLKINSTSNADSPFTHNQIPLLTMDVWEHAYYVDQKNARAKYIKIFLDNLINWDFANENLKEIIA